MSCHSADSISWIPAAGVGSATESGWELSPLQNARPVVSPDLYRLATKVEAIARSKEGQVLLVEGALQGRCSGSTGRCVGLDGRIVDRHSARDREASDKDRFTTLSGL